MFSLIDRISMKQSECGRASPQYQLWYQSEDEGGLRASLDWFLLKSKQRKINWKFLPSISEIWEEIDARSISITRGLHLASTLTQSWVKYEEIFTTRGFLLNYKSVQSYPHHHTTPPHLDREAGRAL